MQYIAVRWDHQSSDDPVEIFSEVDLAGWERRKVELFADGKRSFADTQHYVGDTALSSVPIPSLTEIANDTQFTPRAISHEEFEAVWASTPGAA